MDIVWITFETALGIAALAAAFQGWLLRRASALEIILLAAAGSMLVLTRIVSSALESTVAVSVDTLSLTGLILFAAVLAWQIATRPRTVARR